MIYISSDYIIRQMMIHFIITELSLWKCIKYMFLSTLHQRNLKMQQYCWTGHCGVVLRKIRSGKSRSWLLWDQRIQKAPFLKCFVSLERQKASVFKFLLFEELNFHTGLMQTVGLTIEIKLRFQISLVWCGCSLTLAKCFLVLCCAVITCFVI